MSEEEIKEKTLLEKAEETASRIEKANLELRQLMDRQEHLMATERLNGYSEAGRKPVPPVELTDQEYAAKVLAGEINPLNV